MTTQDSKPSNNILEKIGPQRDWMAEALKHFDRNHDGYLTNAEKMNGLGLGLNEMRKNLHPLAEMMVILGFKENNLSHHVTAEELVKKSDQLDARYGHLFKHGGIEHMSLEQAQVLAPIINALHDDLKTEIRYVEQKHSQSKVIQAPMPTPPSPQVPTSKPFP